MMAAETKDKKRCFIISPIGKEGSDTRRRADKVLRHVIRPPAEGAGYEVVRADEISDPGMITTQIVERLVTDDLVIADLTDHNPNVFYELAIRHALGKPFIQLIDSGQSIPFDVSGFRTVLLDHTDLDSAATAKQQIAEQIEAINKEDYKLVTPLSFTVDMKSFEASGDKEDVYIAKLFDVVQNLGAQVSALQGHIEVGNFDMRKSRHMEHELSRALERMSQLEEENARLKSSINLERRRTDGTHKVTNALLGLDRKNK